MNTGCAKDITKDIVSKNLDNLDVFIVDELNDADAMSSLKNCRKKLVLFWRKADGVHDFLHTVLRLSWNFVNNKFFWYLLIFFF